tara:strand:+ start:67 stop:2178 length:2112 start_codon:yes stop_codon:yes gene_type:complete
MTPSIAFQDVLITTDARTQQRGQKIYELGKEQFPLFAPVTWINTNGRRIKTNVEQVNALVWDIDGMLAEDMQALLHGIKDLCHVAYTSYSHLSEYKGYRHACRIIVAISRPILAREYPIVWRAMKRYIPTDIQTKDCSRLWFYPSSLDTRKHNAYIVSSDGSMLDIDAIVQDKANMVQISSNQISTEHKQQQFFPPQHTTPAPNNTDRYRLIRAPQHLPIRAADGEIKPFSWFISHWEDLPKHTTGNYQCYARGSGSVGSAFISRTVDIWGVARYRLTECNSNKTHLDCINTDGGLEIKYGDKNVSWSYLKSADNLALMLPLFEQKYNLKIWQCEIRQQIYIGDQPLTDALEVDIMNKLRVAYFPSQTLQLAMIKQAIQIHAHTNTRNPIVEYLNGLVWDGKPRINNMLIKYMKAPDTLLSRTYSRKWMISAVARALTPGCEVHTMLVLKAGQGHGKGTFFKTLSGRCQYTNYPWYNSSKINIGEKDGRSILRTAWIHEMAELASLAKKDANLIKNFLDEAFDTYRRVYTTHEVKLPRCCVFAGSANDDDLQIFKDKTGSRRYWYLVLDYIKNTMAFDAGELLYNRDQLWAEAVHAYKKNGEQWHLTKAEEDMREAYNNSYTIEGVHETLVQDYIAALDEEDVKFLNMPDMIAEIYGNNPSLKPVSNPNYYPSLLLRYGCQLVNGGKRCRRLKKNKSGWWSIP